MAPSADNVSPGHLDPRLGPFCLQTPTNVVCGDVLICFT